jgi:hypothetical protein
MGLTSKQRGRQSFAGGFEGAVRAYSADGAISPSISHTAVITKTGSAGVMTLAAPTRDGIVLTVVGRTAFAHQVTATGLIDDGVTGGSKNTLTLAAFAGASGSLISYGGKWNTLSLKAATVP